MRRGGGGAKSVRDFYFIFQVISKKKSTVLLGRPNWARMMINRSALGLDMVKSNVFNDLEDNCFP